LINVEMVEVGGYLNRLTFPVPNVIYEEYYGKDHCF